MTLDAWKQHVNQAAHDPVRCELIARMLHESDHAKQALRAKGYGCTGMGILETVGEVLPAAGQD